MVRDALASISCFPQAYHVMGISYYAVKINKPDAWYLGKDSYGFSDLFPCAETTGFLNKLFTPKKSDLPFLVGSRHIIGPHHFQVSRVYRYAEDMIDKMEKLKNVNHDPETIRAFEAFHEWAGDDMICLIGDFDEMISGSDRDSSCYNLSIALREYNIEGY